MSWAVVALSAAAGVGQIVEASGGLTRIPQFWDTIFHGVAVRHIAETGKASPFSLAEASQPANPDFYYPDVYHAIGAVLLQLPGQALPGVLSALSAATVVVFVVGAAAIASRLGTGPVGVAVAGVAAAATWSFPFGRLNWGPVLPYALGVAAITGVMVLTLPIVRDRAASARRMLLLGTSMAGLMTVHPSVGISAAIIVGMLMLCAGPGARVSALLTVAGAAVVALVVFVPQFSFAAGTAVAGYRWPKLRSLIEVAGEYLTVTLFPPASALWWLAVVIGIVWLIRTRRRDGIALVLAGGVFSVVFWLAYAVGADWAHLFTAIWWDDATRLAALIAVVGVPLVGAGAAALARAARGRGGLWRCVAAGGVVVVVLSAFMAHRGTHGALTTHVYGDGPAVTSGEARIHAELARLHDGGRVLADPFDGSSWVYSVYGVPVVFPAPLAENPGAQVGPQRMVLYTSMARYGFEPVVTQAVRDLDVTWVLVGSGVVGGPGRPPGFVGMGFNPNLELVAANDDAHLYRVLPVPDHPPLPVPPGVPPAVPPIAEDVESLAVVGGVEEPGEPGGAGEP